MENIIEEIKGDVWVWLLPILVITGFGTIIYFTRFNGESDTPWSNKSLIDFRENNAAINVYLDFVRPETGKMEPDQAYVGQALIKLATAVLAAADFANVDMGNSLKQVKVYADQVVQDPLQANQIDYTRKSADIISNALYKVQQSAYPELASEASAVKTAASQIDVNVVINQQTKEVNSFFIKAGELLKIMN
jgi:hypothetical protein